MAKGVFIIGTDTDVGEVRSIGMITAIDKDILYIIIVLIIKFNEH
ncbi:hypothetical protein [Clostridium lacusfryxellense]|nr:hypothetical protein [Clostridium lacusfryxellense]